MFKQKWLNFLLVEPKLSVTNTRAVINTDQIVSVTATQFVDYSQLYEQSVHKLMLSMVLTNGSKLTVVLETPCECKDELGEFNFNVISLDAAYSSFTEMLNREVTPITFLEWK
mgnify:CR=1 FL=1